MINLVNESMIFFELNYVLKFAGYCLIVIIEHDMKLDIDIYTVLQILEKAATDKIPNWEFFFNSKLSDSKA